MREKSARRNTTCWNKLITLVVFAIGSVAHTQWCYAAIGSIAAEFSADSGTATYTIPIQVPAGTAGMQPEVSLVYNSMAGSGIAGMGWSLGGVSAITRCGKTIFDDGAFSGVEYSFNDKFCLDGQRLVLVSGTYGRPGAEYRTKIDNFSRIKSYGSTGNGPEYFTVETKAGQKIEFGRTSDSRIVAAGKSEAFAWALNKITDAADNYMEYIYSGNPAGSSAGNPAVTEYYLSEIKYAGNSSAGTAPYASLNFAYVPRNDKPVIFIGGAKFQTTKQLSKITTKYNTQTAYEYRLSYKDREDEKPSLLQKIHQCADDGDCLPATRFTWVESEVIPEPEGINSWVTGFPDNENPDLGNFITGDINGDGLLDIMSIGNHVEKIYKSTGSSFVQIGTLAKCDNCKLADINGDGKADLIKASSALFSITLQVALSNGSGFGPFSTIDNQYQRFRTTDSNGNSVYRLYPFEVGDVNGDGNSDIVTVHTGGNKLYLSNGNATFRTVSSIDCKNKCSIGDFNGDGRSDLLQRGFGPPYSQGSPVFVALSNGGGFSPNVTWVSDYTINNWDRLRTADVNGDGLSDIITSTVFTSTGGGFELNGTGVGSCTVLNCDFADLNGDSRADKITSGIYVTVNLAPRVDPDRINIIKSGMGSDIKIGYGLLTDTNVHTVDTVTQHPVYPVRAPILLVNSVERDTGFTSNFVPQSKYYSKTTYTFAGLKVHTHGLGVLGFREVSSINSLSGAKDIDVFSQEYPNIGVNVDSKSFRNGVLVSHVTTSPLVKEIKPSTISTTLLPYISRSVAVEYDLLTGAEIKSTITTQNGADIDGFGNALVTTTITKSPDATEVTPELKVVTTSTYYAPNIPSWHLGRLDETTVKKITNSGLESTRTSKFTYNSASGLLESEIIEPHSGDSSSCTDNNADLCISKTTVYQYDLFGNRRVAEVSGYGLMSPNSRKTETHYDSLGRFPEWTKNSLDHTEIYEHDPLCGKKLQITGPNGLVTKWTYDKFCREASETRADETTTTISREYAIPKGVLIPSYAFNVDNSVYYEDYASEPLVFVENLPRSLYRVTTTTTGSPTTHVYYDRLGRELRSETVGFNNKSVYRDKQYNVLGQGEKISRNYYAGEPVFWVNYQFDALGRTILEDMPGDNNSRVITKTKYLGLVTEVTDAKERITTTINDVLGNVIEVNQPEQAKVINRYDPDGNLLETEDAYGHVTKMTYDARGRKLKMDDPNMGVWVYRYNAADDLIYQKDAKGNEVFMAYDTLGRMSKRTEAEGLTTWTYDTQPHGIGKLATVNAPGGYSESITYDSLGRAESTTTTINAHSYTVTTAYDTAGRIKQVTRPGNFVVENVYDDNGYLLAKRSPASQVNDYDKAHLDSLKALAITSASDALAKAEQYAADAAYYEQWAETYRNEVAQNANVQYLTAEVAALQKHKSYKLYTHQSTGELYLESPGRVMILHGEIDTPIMIPPEAHYQVVAGTNSEWTLQAVDLTTWSNSVLPNLADSGEHVFFGDYNGDSKTDYIRSDQNVENPLYDSALLERLAQTANEIQYVSNTLWNLADDALARATQLIAVAGQVEDRQRQAELWAENSDGDDLTEMSDESSGAITYWQANTRDAEHRLTGFRQGNGLVTLRDYDPASGHLMAIQTGFEFGSNIRELEYHYDALDNVTSRHDRVQGVSESFIYDSLDRLKKNSVSGSLEGVSYSYSTDYEYDLTGNILYKSDVGHYTYGTTNRSTGNAGPAALVSAGTAHTGYEYDLNGNLESGGGRIFDWTSFNKPKHLQKATSWVNFTYGPDRARYLKETSNGETTVYIGKLYEKIEQGTKTTYKHFIYAGGELAAIQIKTVDDGVAQPDQTRYMHTDALGSVDTISDGFGSIVERMGFDPFGMRRAGNWNKGLPLELAAFTNRGFTGHEHVDELGIIHMNGRIYDPELGRFLSADPNIQAPLNSQSHNRYSYVANNPLKYTDPSGFFLSWAINKFKKFFDRWGRTVFAIIISIWTGWGVAVNGGGALAAGAAAGAMGGAISTGTIGGMVRGGILGAISAWAAGTIADVNLDSLNNFAEIARDFAHGVAQGVISVVGGGDFQSGFLGGFLGHMSGRYSRQSITGDDAIQVAKRTALASVVGGTVAKAGGGKFANGAVSGAFAHLFNNESSYFKRKATGARFYTLDGDIEASLDLFEVNGEAGHEFHVYKAGKEIGVYRDGNFIAKHGFSGGLPEGMTRDALARLNGLDVDMARRMGRLPAKGRANIKHIFRKFGKYLPFVGAAVTGTEMYNDQGNAFNILTESFGVEPLGDGEMYPAWDEPQF